MQTAFRLDTSVFRFKNGLLNPDCSLAWQLLSPEGHSKMTDSSNGLSETTIQVGDTGVALLRGGSGRTVLVLHEEMGHPGWLSWHSDLARDHSLMVPVHPGFGALPRADWISGVRDLAGFYSRMLRDMALGPVDVIGFSLGGWIAAEMAAADAEQFRSMTLVAPRASDRPKARSWTSSSLRRGRTWTPAYTTPRPPPSSAPCTAASRRPSSSRPGRTPAPSPHASLGSHTCTIPACPTCWRASGACPP